jgi:transposase InsO family protein
MGPDMEEQKTRINLFDGTNFNNWKFRMEVLLDQHELLECLQKEIADEEFAVVNAADTAEQKAVKEKKLEERSKKNRKCKSLIIQAIADSHLECVKDRRTPKEMWDTLQHIFERKGVASQLYLRKKLLMMKLDTTENLGAHFLKFDKIIRELKSTGATVEETDAVCHLLLTLPASFDSVITALETISSEKLSMEFVKSRLLDVEIKRKNSDESSDGAREDNTAFASSSRFKFKCYNCGEVGHKKAECRMKPTRFNRSKERYSYHKAHIGEAEDDEAIAFNTVAENLMSMHWYLDSGASDHMVNDEQYFKDKKRMENPIKIAVAKSGESLKAEYVGDIDVISVVNGKKIKCVVENVLYVPGLKCNLFSVRRMEMIGMKITFEDGNVRIENKTKLVATGRRTGKLYELSLFYVTPIMNDAMFGGRVKNQLQLWHRRFGHLSNANLLKLCKSSMVAGMELDLEEINMGDDALCEPCIAGKQTRLPFNSNSSQRSSRPLQLVHTDICGPIKPATWNGKNYFVSFIDDYTHFTIVYLLSTKDEVYDYFQEYEAMVTAHFGARISRLRSDNGGEYISRKFRSLCISKGISMETTVPYTPQQNGVSERMNRTLMEKARAMMMDCSLPKVMWGESVYTSTYVTNRSPTVAINANKTPFELWYGAKPDVSKLKVFGCTAFAHIPKQLSNKLSSRTKKSFFVGYANNGYRLWSPEDKKIVVARDVIFEEMKDTLIPQSQSFAELGDTKEEIKNHVNGVMNELECEANNNQQEAVFEEMPTETQDNTSEVNQTRSIRTRSAPNWHGQYEMSAFAFNAESYVDDIPSNIEELKKRNDWPQWKIAIEEELESLKRNNTWSLTNLPSGRKAIDCKWVFKIKTFDTDAVDQYKARLVAKGYSQRKGFDYLETYAPVVKLVTVRMLLAIANEKHLEIHQMDVKTAFLNGDLKEQIYMNQPEGFVEGSQVCKLNKAIYGLKQASRSWNEKFNQFMLTLKFRRSDEDYCLYIKQHEDDYIYLILYVDDIILISKYRAEIELIKQKLSSKFEMKDMNEVTKFLGIKIERNIEKGILEISQTQYLMNVLKRFGMENCKPASTPMEPNLRLTRCSESEMTNQPYKELIGCLMYVMLTSRPDLCAAVNYFSRFQSCASDEHWNHLKRVLRYIKGSLTMKLVYERHERSENIIGYADADWANDIEDRKSITGYVFKVFGSTVSWTTRKQSTVSLSSTEAEYIALSHAVCEAIWIMNIMEDIGYQQDQPMKIYEDNQACIRIAEEPREHKRMKHLDVRYNFIREVIQGGRIQILYVPTNEQLADVMTKGLPSPQFKRMCQQLGLFN